MKICQELDVPPLNPVNDGAKVPDGRHTLDKTLAEVGETVRQTTGYYARDWSLWLGWNNMRYIIETALNHAILLNRTLILPSFVYARDCEFPHEVCSAFVQLVNRAESGSEEWRNLPAEDQQGWRIPIQMMFELPGHYPVITTAQFLLSRGLSPDLETQNGQWDSGAYLATAPGESQLSLAYIEPHQYEPEGIMMVDRLPDKISEEMQLNEPLLQSLHNLCTDGTVDFGIIRNVVEKFLSEADPLDEDAALIEAVRPYGIVPIYSFWGTQQFMTKLVTKGVRSCMRRDNMRGWVDEYGAVSEDVLWLQGEHHNGRPPASMRFTSLEARTAYQTLVSRDMYFPPGVEEVGEHIAMRMLERVQGRMWMAVHMRRGDFVRLGWTISGANAFDAHLERVKYQITHGRRVLGELAKDRWANFQLADIPGVEAWEEWIGAETPRDDDPFYVATDEKDPEYLAKLRAEGGLLISDLITPEDRQLLGPPSVLTDFMGLVEQAVMIRAAFWAGHGISSVSGTVGNQRARRGCDVRTTALD
ncbi:hypothetical protein CALVIDRAFT_487290 [Calocera viscosa TUFC12733]|uniref:Uncharacterized protein n=1 Tax=Calocera viscosa (strain TUFC12733) TaxID=1330018 RepID=A0A167IDH4_CALVF|nr:hypothetical protein CALVIDRAFT_487290 [Calocera viscosa TUFC12733]